MDEELKEILDNILISEDNTGCSEDLTVVDKETVDKLRDYIKHYEIGS